MSLREGGRRRLREDGAGDESDATPGGVAVPAILRGFTLERSIHSFSAGRAGMVY